MLAAGSAAMLAGAPSTALLGAWLGWRAAFVLVAALAAVAVAGLLRWGAGITGSARTARWPVVRAPVVGLLAVTTAVLTGSNALLTYLGAVLPTGHPVALAPVLALFGLGGVVGSWWGGCATDRRGGPVVARRTTAALLATFAVFPLLAPTVVGLVAVAVAWGAGVWALVPAQQHRLIHLEPAAAPVLLALHGAASHLGFAAGALLGGLVVDAAGADHLWLVAAGGCAAGLILHALLTKETS